MAADQNAQYERYRRPTKRDAFLATMEQIVPWAALCEVVEPHYPNPGNGRPPVGLERMLRMHFVQHWFNLADAACEDVLTIPCTTIDLFKSCAPFAHGDGRRPGLWRRIACARRRHLRHVVFDPARPAAGEFSC